MLTGKVAIVTGASRGIGAATAHVLCNAGAKVILCSRSAEPVAEVAETLNSEGHTAVSVAADISVKSEAESVIQAALDQFSQLDILVNNAGIIRDTLLVRLKDDDWDAVLQTNLTGTMYCTRAAMRPMLRRKSGRIINISSLVGLVGNAGQSNYAAAKSGVIGFTRSIAKEVGVRNITANVVAPGFIATDMLTDLDPEYQEYTIKQIPLRCFGNAYDVAHAVSFLATDDARYITGHVLRVDGGLVHV